MMPALVPASEAEPSAHVDNSTVDERRHRAAALATGDPATLSQSDRHTRADGEVGVRIKPAVGAGRDRTQAALTQAQGRNCRTRSSPSRGLPRPSRLLVVNHSAPSGAATTVRSRPYCPTNSGTGSATEPSEPTGTR